jgi:hypothetical protein
MVLDLCTKSVFVSFAVRTNGTYGNGSANAFALPHAPVLLERRGSVDTGLVVARRLQNVVGTAVGGNRALLLSSRGGVVRAVGLDNVIFNEGAESSDMISGGLKENMYIMRYMGYWRGCLVSVRIVDLLARPSVERDVAVHVGGVPGAVVGYNAVVGSWVPALAGDEVANVGPLDIVLDSGSVWRSKVTGVLEVCTFPPAPLL